LRASFLIQRWEWPADEVPPNNAANFGVRQIYSAPVYQPDTLPQGTSYTFQQYSSSYYPPNYYGPGTASPMTMQRYLMNSAASPGINPILDLESDDPDPEPAEPLSAGPVPLPRPAAPG
jgi:hypothetical protein